jgi:hypothetical protein
VEKIILSLGSPRLKYAADLPDSWMFWIWDKISLTKVRIPTSQCRMMAFHYLLLPVKMGNTKSCGSNGKHSVHTGGRTCVTAECEISQNDSVIRRPCHARTHWQHHLPTLAAAFSFLFLHNSIFKIFWIKVFLQHTSSF